MILISDKFNNATHLHKALKSIQRRIMKEDWIKLENYVMQKKMEKQFDDVNKKEVIAVRKGITFIWLAIKVGLVQF
jgi:S-adenosylmethionine hydrolase